MALWLVSHAEVYAAEDKPVGTLPPIVAQAAGPGSTIIFWHDVDEDGVADYQGTYAFIDGRLMLLERGPAMPENPGTKRMYVN